MMVISHEIVGGVIGQQLGNPYLAYILAFISHLVLDKIPHYFPKEEKNKATFMVIEIIIACGLILLFYRQGFGLDDVSFWAGLAGGVTMDVLFVGIPALKKSKIGVWHSSRQTHIGKPIYLTIDAVFVIGGLYILGVL
ncbi:MAG: hypothetical protein WCI63_01305 [bacterium]